MVGIKRRSKADGTRNGYLMAIAPNSSTAKIGHSTDGIDPLYEIEFYEEKKNFKFKVTAPGLTPTTYEYYKKRASIWTKRKASDKMQHVNVISTKPSASTCMYKTQSRLKCYWTST